MGFNKKFLFFAIFLFLANLSFAQVCFSEGEKVLDFLHPADETNYYVVVEEGWQFVNKEGVVTTYGKGTSDLVFETGSITATQSELADKTNTVLSKYNKASDYEKLVAKTAFTVSSYPAFFLEFKDLQLGIPDFGKAVVIYGDSFEGKKKYYLFTLRAKEANFDAEKTIFDKMIYSFSLQLISECPEESPPAGGQEPPADDSGEGEQDQPNDQNDSSQDPNEDEEQANNAPLYNTLNTNGQEPAQDNKIFGFEPTIFFGGIIVLFLLFLFVLIVGIIILVLAYLAFFKKK